MSFTQKTILTHGQFKCCENEEDKICDLKDFGWTKNENRIIFEKTDTVCQTSYEKTDTVCQTSYGRTKIELSSLHVLKPGDHIAWRRWYGIWHHALVVAVKPGDDLNLRVIHATGSDVREEDLHADDDMYRVNYDSKYNPQQILERAREIMGRHYGVFSYNCEHFVTECTLGRPVSIQIERMAETIILSCGQMAMRTGITAGTQIVTDTVVNVCQSILHKELLKEAILKDALSLSAFSPNPMADMNRHAYSLFRKHADIADATNSLQSATDLQRSSSCITKIANVLPVFIEGGCVAYDLYKLNELRKNGDISDADFNRTAKQRVSEGAGRLGGVWLGGFVGTFIPIPVVGTAVGSMVGGFVGGLFGRILG